MPSNAETWKSVLSGCLPSVGRQMESWISLATPPDLFEYLMVTLQGGEAQQADFLMESHLVARALLEPGALPEGQARELMSVAMARDSLFDMKLLQRLQAERAWPAEVPYHEIQRCLNLVEDAQDPGRIAVTLLKFSRHPDPRIESKAAKLLGRHLFNMERIEALSKSPDDRVRANLIEGIGRRKDLEPFMHFVEKAAQDPSYRVSTMGHAILARRGHKMSHTILAMRRRSKDDSISWAANYATEVLVKPYLQADDLANLATAVSGDAAQPAVVPAVAEVNSES
ncbi:MAG: hypothetical protein ACK55F_11875 [Acidobacteriota bacterium]|jgi:hypothetical protein